MNKESPKIEPGPWMTLMCLHCFTLKKLSPKGFETNEELTLLSARFCSKSFTCVSYSPVLTITHRRGVPITPIYRRSG